MVFGGYGEVQSVGVTAYLVSLLHILIKVEGFPDGIAIIRAACEFVKFPHCVILSGKESRRLEMNCEILFLLSSSK